MAKTTRSELRAASVSRSATPAYTGHTELLLCDYCRDNTVQTPRTYYKDQSLEFVDGWLSFVGSSSRQEEAAEETRNRVVGRDRYSRYHQTSLRWL